jgi:hypothetical protein
MQKGIVKQKHVNAIYYYFYSTMVRSTWGLKEHMQIQKTFLWSFSPASIVSKK